MVFVKNNAGNNNIASGQEQLKQKSNLKQDIVLNNKLNNANTFVKKDINTLANQQQQQSDIMTDSTKDKTTTSVARQKKSMIEDAKPNNFEKTRSSSMPNSQAQSYHNSTNHTQPNPFSFTFEVNVVAITLFLIAFGFRVYELDQPAGVV